MNTEYAIVSFLFKTADIAMAFQNFLSIFNNSLCSLEIEFLSLSETIIQFCSFYAAYIFFHYLVLFNMCCILFLISLYNESFSVGCLLLLDPFSKFG